MSTGLFVTKSGFNVLTDTDQTHFYFRTDQGTFKFITLISSILTVGNFNNGSGGGFGTTTATQTVSLPSDVNGFAPYYFVSFQGITGAAGSVYDYFATGDGAVGNFYSAWVFGAQLGSTITEYLKYNSGGTTPTNLSVTYNIYVFGNEL